MIKHGAALCSRARELLGCGENEFVNGISLQYICHLRNFVAVPRKRIFDRGGNVVVEEKLHFSACSI